MNKHNSWTMPTVLVVDDEPLLRLNATDALEEAGCRVIEAANADEAIEVMESGEHVDLLVTDIRMPGSMSGLGLTRAIRSRWPEVKVMVTSGAVRPRAHELPEEVRFLSKPYPAWKLADAAQRLAH